MAIAVLFIAFTFSSACGYRSVASAPKGDEAAFPDIAVPISKNETSYPGIAAPFTAEVRKRLAALGIEVSAEQNGKAPTLNLVIVSVRDETGMTVRRGDILAPSDIAWSVDVMVSLDSPDGERIIPPTRFSGDGRSLAMGAGTAGETYLGARTQREIMDELASRIAAMVAMLH